jgi:hypothetical protein
MNSIEAITPAELSRAAAVFGTMKQLRLQHGTADEAALDKAFEVHVQSVLEKLDNRLPTILQHGNEEEFENSEQSQQLLNVEVIMAKHGLYDAAFQQVVMLCQTSKFSIGLTFASIVCIIYFVVVCFFF